MVQEYIAKIKGDTSALEKVISQAQGKINRLSDDEVLIKLNYDGNVKEFNKVFDKMLKAAPELTIQFQYDVNKKILDQEMKKLQQINDIKLNIDQGTANKKINEMTKSIRELYNAGAGENELGSRMKELLKYANTLEDLGVNTDKSFKIELEEIASEFESLDDLLQKNEQKPYKLFTLDKSLDKTLADTQERVNDLKSTLDSLKEKGAKEVSETSEFKELSDKVRILTDDIEEMKGKLESLSGEQFDEMAQSVANLEEKLQGALDKIQELSSKKINPKNITYHIGDFDESPYRYKAESVNHIIHAMNWGDFDTGGLGFGILGTGVYHTPNAWDLQMGGDNPKGYAIDLSKYRMVVAKTTEQAEQLMRFFGQFNGFVVAQGSDYRGWDEVLKDVNVETLYKQFQEIFGDTVMDVKDFQSFLDKMISQMKEISAGGLQVDDRFSDFKDMPAKYDHYDTPITQFLKKLGYEGVDLRGTDYDDYNQGNTIFDLKKEDIIAVFNSQEELDEHWKQTQAAIKNCTTEASDSLDETKQKVEKLSDAVEELTDKVNGLNDAAEKVGDATTGTTEEATETTPEPEVSKLTSEPQQLYEDPSGQLAFIKDVIAAEEKLSDVMEEVADDAKKATEQIEGQLSLDFSKAESGEESIADAEQEVAEKAAKATDNIEEENAKIKDQHDLLMRVAQSVKKVNDDTNNAGLNANTASKLFEDSSGQLSFIEDVTAAEKKLSSAMEEVAASAKKTNGQIKGQLTLEEVISDSDKAHEAIKKMLRTLNSLDDSKKYIPSFIESIDTLRTSLKELAKQNFIEPEKLAVFEDELQKLKDFSKTDYSKNFQEITRSKHLDQISQYLTKYTGLSQKTRTEIEKIAEAMRKANNAGELKDLYTQFLNLKMGARAAGEEVQSMFTKISNRLADMNAKFIAQFFSIQDLIRYVRELATNVIAVDSALTELRKVSDASTDRLTQSFQKSSETALELGQSIEHVINVTADWARLGYDVDAAEELARVTTLFTTVGDNMTSDDASSYLISTLQGFQMAADQSEEIVDKYNNVANKFAIDTAGIGQALQRSAASFNAANTDLSKSIALITATNEVVQNPESVGTLWKTMSARIRGAKTELEDLGEEQDAFTETTSKLRDMVKSLTGFDIMKSETEFKDIYEIILGIGKEWDKLTDIERASLGEALAGKRNANALYAVLGNLDTLQGAYKAAEDAAGSAAREQENYAKSIQYSLDRFQATIEKISVDLLNSDFLKGAVESATELLGIVDQLASKSNGLISIIAGIGAGFSFNKFGGTKGIISGIQGLVQDFRDLNTLIQNYNEAVADSTIKSKLYVKSVTEADNAMGKYFRSLKGGKASLHGYIVSLKAAKTETIATKLATAALDAAITMGITLAVTGLISWITKLVKAQEEARKTASELAETYESESKSLDEEIAKYEKLNQQLKDAYKKGADTYDIKEQLLELQKQLNEKYSDEYEKLNLVNGAYAEQIGLLREISKKKGEDYLSKNSDQIKAANEYLERQRTYTLGNIQLENSKYNGEELKNFLNRIEGVEVGEEGFGVLRPVMITANIEDADKIMGELYTKLVQYGKTHDLDMSWLTDQISKKRREIEKDSAYIEYKAIRDQSILATIAANDDLSSSYEKGVEAVNAYNEALESGKGVNKAKENLDKIRSEIENTEFDSEGVREKFLAIFDGIDDDLEKKNAIDDAFATKDSELMQYAERLRGLTDIDLTSLTDSKTKASFNYLLHTFGLTEDNADILIDKLVELGIVTRGLAEEDDKLAKSQAAWASERDAALDKLKLRKETSSGVEYDEEWTNYLEVMKELNPLLKYNQEELEKYALANLQFSKGVEDLSKNFKTYKEALKDADELTPEYSEAITALADDLTYLTGIKFNIEEAADFLSVTKNVENLEKAINGSDEALQQLQTDAKKSITLNINKADVNSLYNTTQQLLKDIPKELEKLSKGGNVDLNIRPKIDTQWLRDVGWKDVEDGYATVFTKTFSNEAGDIAINFTPIIVDENGNYVDVMEPEALEKYAQNVINGADDELNLQIGAKFTGEDAIAQAKAAAQEIHELHEIQIELGLDTDDFYNQFYDLALWLETADLGTIEAQAYLDDSPFIQALTELASQSTVMAEKIKKVFEGLGWDVTWDTAKMKVPKAGGSKKTSVYAPSDYMSKQLGSAYSNGVVSWDYEEMDVPTNIHFERRTGSTTRKTSTSSYTPSSMSSAQKTNAASNIDKSNKSGNSSADKFYDYFERLIAKLDHQIDMLDAHLEDVVGSAAKNTILDAEEDLIQQKLNGYTSAIQMYSEEASKALAKIPSDIAEKLINGAVDVDEFVGEANEDVYEAIQNYTKWAEKVEDCQKQLVELKEAIRQLELQKFNNILEDFNNQIDLRQSSGLDLISKQIELLKEAGELVGESYYKKQIELTKKNLASLEDAKSALADQMNEALNNGIDVGSDEWLEMVKALTELEGKILDAKKALEEFDNALLKLHTEVFNMIQDQFDSYENELSNLRGLFSEDKIADDNGEYTKEGLAQLGLLAQEYELARYRVEQYNKEIAQLNADYKAGKYSAAEYAEKLAELKQKQWDNVNAAEEAKKAMIELEKARVEIAIEAIEKEIDAFEKLIDAEKEALKSEKELNEYRKSIRDANKSIIDVQKQLAAIEGDNSASAIARRKKLEEQLSEAKQKLSDLEADHEYDTKVESLDKQLEAYKEMREKEIEDMKKALEDIEATIEELFEKVRQNAEQIGDTIEDEATEHGIQISEVITDAWHQGEDAINKYGETLDSNASAFIENLNEVENNMWKLQDDANATADTLANMFATRADDLVTQLTDSYNSEANLDAMTNALHQSLSDTIDGRYSGASAVSAVNDISDAVAKLQKELDEAKRKYQELLQEKENENGRKKRILWSGKDKSTAIAQAAWYGYDESHVEKNGDMWQVWGYKKGTQKVTKDQLAWTQEEGPEMIISPSTGAILTPLKMNDAVIPADMTSNLWEWSKFNPEEFAEKLLTSTEVPSGTSVQNNTMEIGSLVTVNGNVNDSAEMMQIAAQQATAKIKQSFYDLSNGLNKQ